MLNLGDYGTDTPAFQAFLAALAAQGGEGVIPRGDYVLSGSVSASFSRAVRLVGEGPGSSNLIFASGGLDLSYSDVRRPPTIEGLELRTQHAGVGGYTGLKITGPAWGFGAVPGAAIRDVAFRGDDLQAHAWSTNLDLEGCWNPVLDRVYVKGQNQQLPPFASQVGMLLNGCMAPRVRNLDGYHIGTGLRMVGGEGLQLAGGELVGVDVGIEMTDAAGYRPGTSISGGHVNAFSRCLKISHRSQLAVVGMLLYKTPASTAEWQAIEIVNSESIVVKGCDVRGNPTDSGPSNGITLAASYGCVIQGNVTDDFSVPGAGILLAAGSDRNYLLDNRRGLNVGGVTGDVLANVIR